MLAFITKTSLGPTGYQTRRLPGQQSNRTRFLLRFHRQTSPPCVSGRYIDSQHCRVMQDIVSSKLYAEQFDAIQDCFRIIGFTEEVTRASSRVWSRVKHFYTFLLAFSRRSTPSTKSCRPF